MAHKALSTRASAAQRRERFVAEYLKDRNGKRAAIAAGYSPRSAESTASDLLREPKVAAAIAKVNQRHIQKLELSRENVLDELRAIAFAHPLHFGHVTSDGGFRLDLSQTTDDQFRSFPEIRTKVRRYGKDETGYVEEETSIKVRGKREALVDLGRHLGLFEDDANRQTAVTFVIAGLAAPGTPQEVIVATARQIPAPQPKRPSRPAPGGFRDPARES